MKEGLIYLAIVLGCLLLSYLAVQAYLDGGGHIELISPAECWDKGGFWSKGLCYW